KIVTEAPPREITFLVDVSGSMGGSPTAKVRQTLEQLLKGVKPTDKANLITFAGCSYNVFPEPQPATAANVAKILDYTRKYRAGGGTQMLPAIRAALGQKSDPSMMRVVIMLTDGYIGNEKQIIEEVGNRCGDSVRFWCLGIGNSVNRFLVDGVAKQGGGMGQVLSLKSSDADVKGLAARMMHRIHRAQIADISINWGNLDVSETYPARVPELWAGRPVILFGRYKGNGEPTTIRLKGLAEGKPISLPVEVNLPEKQPANDCLSTVWARKKIKTLMHEIWTGANSRTHADRVKEVTDIALEHRLMTQYTSFVAVEEKLEKAAEDGKPPKRVRVPVSVPDGVLYQNTVSDIAMGGTGVTGAMGVGGGGMAGSFGYRNGGGRKRAVMRFGGSLATESSVEAALNWLVRHQDVDGSWNPSVWKTAAKIRGQSTGLATLAFLGAGYTTKTGKYRATVAKATAWIKSKLKPVQVGQFGTDDTDSTRAHAIMSLALSEAHGMDPMAGMRAPAQKALDGIGALRAADCGWAARPGAKPDTVTTAWFVFACKSARIAGLKTDSKNFQSAAEYLGKATRGKGHASSLESKSADPRSTMAGAAARLMLGYKREQVRDAVRWAFAEGLKADLFGKKLDPEFVYFGTLASFQVGGEDWKKWNAEMKKALVSVQSKGGPMDGSVNDVDGSWPAAAGAPDLGRLYASALFQLTLEVYYRYLPMYSK
ncbi:MAG: VWA domain-containing protein, partial [Planctomycetota bacterium]